VEAPAGHTEVDVRRAPSSLIVGLTVQEPEWVGARLDRLETEAPLRTGDDLPPPLEVRIDRRGVGIALVGPTVAPSPSWRRARRLIFSDDMRVYGAERG
jgi:hypothetical protein